MSYELTKKTDDGRQMTQKTTITHQPKNQSFFSLKV